MRAQVSQYMLVVTFITLLVVGVYLFMELQQDQWTNSSAEEVLVSQSSLQASVRDILRECTEEGVKQAFWGLAYDARPLAPRYVVAYDTYVPFFEEHVEEWRIELRMEWLIRERIHLCMRKLDIAAEYAQMRPATIKVNVTHLAKGSTVLIDMPVMSESGIFTGKATRFTSSVPIELDQYWEATKVITQLATGPHVNLQELCEQFEINGKVAIIPIQHEDGWWMLRLIDYETHNTKFVKSFILQMYLYGVKNVDGRCYEV